MKTLLALLPIVTALATPALAAPVKEGAMITISRDLVLSENTKGKEWTTSLEGLSADGKVRCGVYVKAPPYSRPEIAADSKFRLLIDHGALHLIPASGPVDLALKKASIYCEKVRLTMFGNNGISYTSELLEETLGIKVGPKEIEPYKVSRHEDAPEAISETGGTIQAI